MATFKSFEEIEAWQNARGMSDKIFKLTQQGSFAKDFKLWDQINGASGSIMDNIAEGFERNGTREFVQFLSIAKGSAGETRSQLYRAFDRNYITTEIHEELQNEVLKISRRLSSLIDYLKTSGLSGSKYMKEPDEPYPSNFKP